MTRSRLMIIVPVAALLAALGVFAVVGALAGNGGSGAGGSGSGASDSGAVSSSTGHAAAGRAIAGAPQSAAEPATQGKAPSTGGSSSYAADIPAASTQGPHYLLRNGSLGLQVPRGELLSAVSRITALTTGLEGYVVSSSVGSEPIPWPQATASAGGAAQPGDQPVASSGNGYASVIVRVPGAFFDTALRRFAAVGTVQSVSTSSDDVTSQYVDLRARLQHYRAVERRLVSFLGATTNVNQALMVQDRINSVQLTIEELTAQFKALRQTTTYGTITVSLTERGRHVTTTATTTTFGGTFRHSLDLLARGARDTALAVVAALPFVLVLGGLALTGWAVARRYRRRRPPAQPSLPA
jgi:hypothetical protein